MIRQERVLAFCDWLSTLPAGQNFEELEQYRFFNLTDAELLEVEREMVGRYVRLAHQQDVAAVTSQTDVPGRKSNDN